MNQQIQLRAPGISIFANLTEEQIRQLIALVSEFIVTNQRNNPTTP